MWVMENPDICKFPEVVCLDEAPPSSEASQALSPSAPSSTQDAAIRAKRKSLAGSSRLSRGGEGSSNGARSKLKGRNSFGKPGSEFDEEEEEEEPSRKLKKAPAVKTESQITTSLSTRYGKMLEDAEFEDFMDATIAHGDLVSEMRKGSTFHKVTPHTCVCVNAFPSDTPVYTCRPLSR